MPYLSNPLLCSIGWFANLISILVSQVHSFHDFGLSHERNVNTVGSSNSTEWNKSLHDGRGRFLQNFLETDCCGYCTHCGTDISKAKLSLRNWRLSITVCEVYLTRRKRQGSGSKIKDCILRWVYQCIEGLIGPLPEQNLWNSFIKLQHGSHDEHASWDLEWHPTKDILKIPSVWVEAGFVEFHCIHDLKILSNLHKSFISQKLHYITMKSINI